ncbi:MAG: hypothetical protein Terrestrivirus4_39 [Terrestrivirus sp.]|uniref:Uncharacterized protein n=1 Tax=Terrestrivirus sp. TaxID=2487775 RepID=A0A3G4ZPU2_9VIRU|nr:MAG: hypothetical protein Terrestrivirus4_39 [Terrestrivirus sp.]
MMMTELYSKDGFILNGIKIDLRASLNNYDLDSNLDDRGLFICLHNYSFDRKTSNIVKYLPHIVNVINQLENYKKINILLSYPKIINFSIISNNTQDITDKIKNVIDSIKIVNAFDRQERDTRLIEMMTLCNNLINESKKSNEIKLYDTILLSNYSYIQNNEIYSDVILKILEKSTVGFFNTSQYINNPLPITKIQIDRDDVYSVEYSIYSHFIKLVPINFIVNIEHGPNIINEYLISNSIEFSRVPEKFYFLSCVTDENRSEDSNEIIIKILDKDSNLLETVNCNVNNLDKSNDKTDAVLYCEILTKRASFEPNDNKINEIGKKYNIDVNTLLNHIKKFNTTRNITDKIRIIQNNVTNSMIKNKNFYTCDDRSGFSEILNKFAEMSQLHIVNKDVMDKVNETIVTNITLFKNVVDTKLNKIYDEVLKSISEINNDNNDNNDNHDNNDNNDQNTDSNTDSSIDDFFASPLTLTNWKEELSNGGSMGLMIRTKSNDLSKIGANGIKPTIESFTTTFIPTKDFIECILINFEKNLIDNVDNVVDVIGGGNNVGIGDGNTVIPLYINKNHWKLARIHLEYVLGIVLVNNPFGYIDSHLNFMFYMLAEMTRHIFMPDEVLNLKMIKTYLSVFRTCCEIAQEKKYHKGIKKMIGGLLENNDRIMISRPFDNDVLFGQILATGSTIDNIQIKELCYKIYENIFWRNYTKNYDKQYLKEIFVPIIHKNDPDELINEIQAVINFVTGKISVGIQMITSNCIMIDIMKTLIHEEGGFMKFLNNIEKNFESENNIVNKMVELIKSNKIKMIEPNKVLDLSDNKMRNYCVRSMVYDKFSKRKTEMENKKFYNTYDDIDDIVTNYYAQFL